MYIPLYDDGRLRLCWSTLLAGNFAGAYEPESSSATHRPDSQS